MNTKHHRRKSVPVSKLAWYAADPSEFRQYQGGTRNASSARAGDEAHHTLASPAHRVRRLGKAIVLALIVAIGLMFILSR